MIKSSAGFHTEAAQKPPSAMLTPRARCPAPKRSCNVVSAAHDAQMRPSPELVTAYKAGVKALFDARSTTYGADREFHAPLVRRIVDLAPLRPGQAVLDIGTGTGEAALAVAAIVGSSGSVVGLDISSGMVDEVGILSPNKCPILIM